MIPYAPYNALLTLLLIAASGASLATGLWQIAAAALALDLLVRLFVVAASALSVWLTGSPLVSECGLPSAIGRVLDGDREMP